jgi:hypothetical protein
MAKPNLPFKGEKATISKVEETVNIAPSKSGKTCLGVSFHGRFGLATSRV